MTAIKPDYWATQNVFIKFRLPDNLSIADFRNVACVKYTADNEQW